MATVTKTFSGYTTHYLQLDVTDTGKYSSENNKSEIAYKVTLNKVSTSSGAWTETAYPARFVIDNKIVAQSNVVYDVRNTLSQVLLQGTTEVQHDADGKKTISCTASYTTSGNLGSATTPALELKLIDIPLAEGLYLKRGGRYSIAVPFVKTNEAYKQAKKIYVKVNGTWKESSVYV